MKLSYENQLKNWVNKEKVGVSLLKSSGTLMYEHGIELVLFRNKLLEIGVSELLSLFEYANNELERKTTIDDALELANSIIKMNLPPSKIDIGLLTAEYNEGEIKDYDKFLFSKLNHINSKKTIKE